MTTQTILPKKSGALMSLLPVLIFILWPLYFISYQIPNVLTSIALISIVLVFLMYILNRNINKIVLSENYIEFFPCLGKKPFRKINFDKILNIVIFKYKDNRHKIMISTTDGKNHEIYTNHYSADDKNTLIYFLKSHTSSPIKEVKTYSFIILMFSSLIIYQASRIIEHDILTTDHYTSSNIIFIIFILLTIPTCYICNIIIKKENSPKILFIFSPLLSISTTFSVLDLFYLYNEHYPSSTYYVELKLNKKDGNYQTWQLSDEAQKILMINQERLSTYIKPQQLPKNVTLKQDSNYQATIQTGLIGDVFIIANTIKPVN